MAATKPDMVGRATTFEGSGQTIVNVDDTPTGAVTISGTAAQGQILNAQRIRWQMRTVTVTHSRLRLRLRR